MTTAIAVPVWLAVAILIGVGALLVVHLRTRVQLREAREQADHLVAAALEDADALRTEVGRLQQRLDDTATLPVPVAVVDDREYLITDLAPERGPRTPAAIVPAPLFADIVLRESVIRTAALAAGLRRALSPEVRHRIRFEMRREVKRSRKARKVAVREARRELAARENPRVQARTEAAS